jgi:thioredoxin-related protein
MKHILLVLALVFTLTISAQEINWVTLEQAVELQKKNPKKIIMDVYTSWCGPCKMLDRNTFQNKDVAAYINKNYYAVKFDAEGKDEVTFQGKTYKNPGYKPENANRRNAQHELAGAFGVRSYPTMLFLDEKNNLITPIIGYKTPQQLELYLKMFKNNDHTSMTSQEEFNTYFESFKYEFKG